MELPPIHVEALNRTRRIALNFDVSFAVRMELRADADRPVEQMIDHLFEFSDDEQAINDSIWWNWTEGNQVPYPSKFLPQFDDPHFQKWLDEGTDIVGLVLEATRERGIEAFYAHRMNGSDNDLGPFAVMPMKVEHPDWQFRTSWSAHEHSGYWNFALPQVHDCVIRNLREVAENYSFDGFDLDFARGVVFPSGEGWVNHERLTDFIRGVRAMLMEIADKRGRPILLSCRVPETLMGCHFDGLDVERWAAEQLVDILAPGCRSFEADLAAFRRITAGTHIKIYPSIDDHHASDGYQNPGIEVLRGVAANWHSQGADGILTFNWNYASDAPYAGQEWESHLQAYKEIGEAGTLARKDKVFVVQRRGGGHGPTVIPNAEDWFTPRYSYANTNMLSQLPATLDNEGKVDRLLQLYVGDDLTDEDAANVKLRLLLSDPDAVDDSPEERLDKVQVAHIGHPKPGLDNTPPLRSITSQIEVRLNNSLLPSASVDGGWLEFAVRPKQLALGENLIGVRIEGRAASARPEVLVEKLEIHIQY